MLHVPPGCIWVLRDPDQCCHSTYDSARWASSKTARQTAPILPPGLKTECFFQKQGGWGTLAPADFYSVNSPWKISDSRVSWMRPHTRKHSCHFMSCPRLCLLPWCTNCTSLLHSAGNSWCPCLHRPVRTVRQEEQREFHTANPFLSEAMQVLQDCKAQHKAGLTASTQPTETLTTAKAVHRLQNCIQNPTRALSC